MKNKIIFLDHDGVMALSSNWGTRFKKKGATGTIDDEFDNFDKKAIKILNEIIEVTDCEIVISSDWKHFCTLAQMQDLYRMRGVIKVPIDFTAGVIGGKYEYFRRDSELEETRCIEIKEWLDNHPTVTKWVAVDDMELGLHFSFNTLQPTIKEQRTIELTPENGYQWGLRNFVRCPNSSEGIKQSGIKEKIIKFLK